MEIVRLVPDDWATFRDLRSAALSEAPYAFGSTLDDEHRLREPDWRAKLASRAQFVARDPGALGTVGAYRDGDTIDLISMWVEPVARGRGIGAALVARVIAHARQLGCRQVRLWVTEGNDTAERLYTRCGFVRTGAVQPRRAGEPICEAEMVRAIA